ncbi:hypothetical protein EK904_003093, partial [Melospiza melodia maxima]
MNRRTCPFVASMNSKFFEVWRLQFQVKQLYFPQNNLHVKLTHSDVILLLPNEFLCACKAHTVQAAECTLVLSAPLLSQSLFLLSRVLLFTCCSFHRLGYTTGKDRDRNHFCLPGMETSPATFLSPRVVFRKWLSFFGLHKSSAEAFSCVALHALPGLLVMWAHRVFTLQLKDTSTALQSSQQSQQHFLIYSFLLQGYIRLQKTLGFNIFDRSFFYLVTQSLYGTLSPGSTVLSAPSITQAKSEVRISALINQQVLQQS